MATTKKPRKQRSDLRVVKRHGKLVAQDRTELFMEEFLKNGGDVTQAALKVGNYSNLSSAQAAGSRYLSRAKSRGLIRSILEKKGYGYGKLIDVALEKMEKSKKPDWWDRLMKMADLEDFTSGKASPGVTVETMNVFNAHRKLSEDYIEAEDAEVVSEDPAQDED